MGGAVKVPGNISDLIPDTENTKAEWNIYADPKAAEHVFTTLNLPIWLVPVDITCQMPMTRAFHARLDKETLPALKLVKDMLTSLLRGMGEKLFYDKLQFWDSLSAMIALNPLMASFEELSLTIDLSTSQTKIDEASSSQMSRVQVATKLINVEAAYDTFLRLMKTGMEPVMTNSGYNRTFFGLSKSVVFSQKSLAPEIQHTNTLT